MTDTMTKNPTMLMICLGLVPGQKKPLSKWFQVSEEEFKTGTIGPGAMLTDRERLYEAKTAKLADAGQVFRVEYKADEPTTIYPRTLTFLGLWPDVNQRVLWAAEAREVRMVMDAQKQQRNTDDALVAQLKPVREAYRRAIGANKARLLASVVAIITG
jgi:hypothetical protein